MNVIIAEGMNAFSPVARLVGVIHERPRAAPFSKTGPALHQGLPLLHEAQAHLPDLRRRLLTLPHIFKRGKFCAMISEGDNLQLEIVIAQLTACFVFVCNVNILIKYFTIKNNFSVHIILR